MKMFDRENLPPIADFSPFRKRVPTLMVRIDGPFTVATIHGTVTCEDGYLAIDAAGWPYPVDAVEFSRVYEPVENT